MRTLNVAVAGLGFMGVTHARAWSQIPAARLAAVVSSDARKLAGDFTSVGGNLERDPPTTRDPLDLSSRDPLDLSSVRKYSTFAEALADDSIDAIDICFPTDRHASAALEALAAGKHVLVEKPLALDPADCRRMLAAAKQYDRILMAGQVLRFVPAWANLKQILETGGSESKLPVRSAVFRRRCGAPDWSPWLTDPKRSGGGVFDLLIHDVDFCISVWGMPARVTARGYQDLSRGIDVVNAELSWPGIGPVLITGGWHHPKSCPFSMEFTVVTDPMTIEWTSADDAVRLFRADGEMELGILNEVDPFEKELAYFADCALSATPPDLCPPEESAQAVELMVRILESRARGGEPVLCR